MSKFHASIRDILEDVQRFLSLSLQKEVLSNSAISHKEYLLARLKTLENEYPELQLNFNVSNETSNCTSFYPPSSPIPYVDMNGGSPYKIPFILPTVLVIMDVERNDAFLPVVILTEDMEKIALMKAALKAYTDEYEHILTSMQKRLKAGQRQIQECTQESNEIDLQLNALELQILEAQQLTQESESEAVQTVKENRIIKRKIITLKNDIEDQEKLVKRANEVMQAVQTNSFKIKKLKLLKHDAAS